MRGDRPLDGSPESIILEATPHARGSTPDRETEGGQVVGYPACAGIDPAPLQPDSDRKRLPRMRGDRPGNVQVSVVRRGATPHARGSTFVGFIDQALSQGYPACAGIDPTKPSRSNVTWRLPRMRGDRPHSSRTGTTSLLATPHARGSTLLRHRGGIVLLGYPACAGIDPTHRRRSAASIWLPRMRGDRPCGIIIRDGDWITYTPFTLVTP